MKQIDWSLYVLTDRRASGERSTVEVVRAVVRGGATAIQLRNKEASTRALVELGRALLDVTRPAGVPLIVNDRIDVALAIDADGAHVGQEDMPAPLARRLLGPERILGVSAGTVEEALQAQADGADYVGTGDVYGTPPKADAGVPIGVDGLAAVARAASIPVIAIGGIQAGNAAAAVAAGASGVAVISAVIGAADPEAAARELREITRDKVSGMTSDA